MTIVAILCVLVVVLSFLCITLAMYAKLLRVEVDYHHTSLRPVALVIPKGVDEE